MFSYKNNFCNLSDGTNYEMVYSCYGVKNGSLKSTTGDFEYFASADIGAAWDNVTAVAFPIEV